MHANRRTSTLFSSSLILPFELEQLLKERNHSKVEVVVFKQEDVGHAGNGVRSLELTLSEATRNIALPTQPFLEAGYRSGDALQFSYDGELISVFGLTSSLEEQQRKGEVGPDGISIPPAWLIQAFTGVPNTTDHVVNGIRSAEFYVDLYNRYCGDYTDLRKILDFGCGCGRVLMRMPTHSGTQYYGVDLHPAAVEWLQRAMPEAIISRGNGAPPISLDVIEIDFLYAISVLTHLSQEKELAWLSEWARIMADGGHLFVTFRGEDWVQNYATEAQAEVINEVWNSTEGFCYQQHKFWDGIFPSYYAGTYHTRKYVKDRWGSIFDLVDIVPSSESPNQQNIAVMKKK